MKLEISNSFKKCFAFFIQQLVFFQGFRRRSSAEPSRKELDAHLEERKLKIDAPGVEMKPFDTPKSGGIDTPNSRGEEDNAPEADQDLSNTENEIKDFIKLNRI